MIVDSSALVAIMLKERQWEELQLAIANAAQPCIGAPTLLETGIVLTVRLGFDAHDALAQLIRQARISVLPFGDEHASVAASAWLRYGKGRHPAGLNYGDCMSYAMSKVEGLPLLYVGDDFARTDVEAAAT